MQWQQFKTIGCGLIGLLGMMQTSWAQSNSCQPLADSYKVFYINGIITTEAQARREMEELKDRLGTSYGNQPIEYELAYNFTEGTLRDLVQAYQQQGLESWRDMLGWVSGTSDTPRPDWMTHDLLYLQQQAYQEASPELNDHVAKYRESIMQGKKTLLVGYSQGGYYANQAYDILINGVNNTVSKNSLNMFFVATPASSVAGSTSNEDYLVHNRDTIRLVSGSLPPNWTIRYASNGKEADELSTGDIDGHFLYTYLSSKYDALPVLTQRVQQKLNLLVKPPQVFGSGPISVTMGWDKNQTDLDLQVFEPNGMHVYYADKKGTVGYLDADDTSGYGPEHYFTDCNQILEGDYVFSVNYFSDYNASNNQSTPVNATFTVTTPTGSRTFNKLLSQEMGSAGTANPIRVFKVSVKKSVDSNPNKNGLLTYTIVPL